MMPALSMSVYRTAIRTAISRTSAAPLHQLPFTSSALCQTKQMPPRPKLPDSEIHEVFLKGSGPGGQKINKTNSAVQLRHIPTGVVVKYQDTRSREQNRKVARQLLAQRVDELLHGAEARSKVVEREKAKKKASAGKKSRRKYRALEEEKSRAAIGDADGEPGSGESDNGDEASAVPKDDVVAHPVFRIRAVRQSLQREVDTQKPAPD